MLPALPLLTLLLFQGTGAPSRTEHIWILPRLGYRVRETRLLDRKTGTIVRRTTLEDGTLVDLETLRARERKLARRADGAFAPELQERMAVSHPGEMLPVVFWLETPGAPDFRLFLEDALAKGVDGEEARRLTRDAAARFYRPFLDRFSDRLLEKGIEATQAGGAWPVVFARLPLFRLEEWKRDPAVNQIYLAHPRWMPESDLAQATMRAPTAWARGVTGAANGVKVLVNDLGHVSDLNPFLPSVRKLNGGGAASHATAVGGNIAFHMDDLRGAAWELPEIYSGNGASDSAAPGVWNKAISAGVCFGNCSWWNGNKGRIVFLDRFFDFTLRNFAMMMFKSTGNQGTSPAPFTTTPGNGFNMTCTGAYNDGDTPEWDDDAMAGYSSFWNPVEGHEKPELASPGDGVVTAGSSAPWTQYFTGTSSASPLTCGVAALLAARDPALKTSPEAVKAILMVSAWHNLEGDALLSDADGAGGVHAAAADAVVRKRHFRDGILTPSSFDASGHLEIPLTAYAGDETRVIALWFSKADAAGVTDVLQMDLDLMVVDPTGLPVAVSASPLNPFELARFVPKITGTYTIRLVRQRFEGTSEPYCVAWSSRQDTAAGEIRISGVPAPGKSFKLTFRDPYHNGVWFQARASKATLPFVVPLADGVHVLPLQPDRAFRASSRQPGFEGILDASGQASVSLALPAKPGLSGRTLQLAFFTKPAAASSWILETSPAIPLTIQ